MNSSNLLPLILQSKGVRWITLGWVGFIAENLILSENRQYLIETIGDDNYHLIYSTLSTLACGSIAYGYIRHGRGTGPTISAPGIGRKVTGLITQTLGLVGFSQAIPLVRMPYTYVEEPAQSIKQVEAPPTLVKAWRCPMDFRSNELSENDVFGVERITRHAVFWSFGLFTLSSALYSIYIPEIVMFTFPSIFALIGGAHQDHRFLKGSGGNLTKEKYEKTSHLPFGAILTGKQKLSDVCHEIKTTNLSIALGASLLLGLKRFLR